MESKKYQEGMKVRREVLGDVYVDKAMNNANDFIKPLHALITENAWGEVWVRDGISRQTRSLVTIAALVAMRTTDEIKIHLRGALRNGCTVEEIREVLLQCAVYCGMPAALEAFNAARDIIDEWESGERF